jgi:hypothetical protein
VSRRSRASQAVKLTSSQALHSSRSATTGSTLVARKAGGKVAPSATWVLVLGELVALFGVVFCYSGMAMAGSFTISNPEQADHWRFVATVYQVLMGVCFVAAIVILLMVSRSRRGT